MLKALMTQNEWPDGGKQNSAFSYTEVRTKPFVDAIKIRPEIITNNRLGIDGDIKTPEQFVPVTGHEGDWETCITMNRHWGYNAYDTDWMNLTGGHVISKAFVLR